MYLYEYIDTTPRVSDVAAYLREANEDVTIELVQRQVMILRRKELLSYVVLYEDASLKITGEGCVKAEVVLVDREKVKAQREAERLD